MAMMRCVRRFSDSMRSEAHSGYMAHVTVEDKRNTDTKRNVLCNTKETLVLGYIEKKKSRSLE